MQKGGAGALLIHNAPPLDCLLRGRWFNATTGCARGNGDWLGAQTSPIFPKKRDMRRACSENSPGSFVEAGLRPAPTKGDFHRFWEARRAMSCCPRFCGPDADSPRSFVKMRPVKTHPTQTHCPTDSLLLGCWRGAS